MQTHASTPSGTCNSNRTTSAQRCGSSRSSNLAVDAGVAVFKIAFGSLDRRHQVNVVRNCTIPRDRAVLFQLATALNDYPCPEPPPFQPAPGQSPYDFLLEGIAPLVDNEPPFTVTLDGVEIVNPRNYRFTSPDIFFIDGNLSLQATFDNCITGKPQPAVSDGFFFMFKPLPPGEHTIAAVGQNRQTGLTMTLTQHLTIR